MNDIRCNHPNTQKAIFSIILQLQQVQGIVIAPGLQNVQAFRLDLKVKGYAQSKHCYAIKRHISERVIRIQACAFMTANISCT